MVYIKRGFTLVELMIVIGVIGVLSAVIYPYVSGYLERGKNTARIGTTKNTIESIVSKYPESLISYYPFEEGGGNIVQDKSNNNANTVSFPINGITYKQGQIGRGIECNGIGTGASHPSLNLIDELSISLWMYSYQVPSTYAVQPISKWTYTSDSTFVLYYFGETSGGNLGRVSFYATPTGGWNVIAGASPSQFPLNKWTMVSMTYSSLAGGQLYLDGIAAGSPRPPLGTLATNGSPFRICGMSATFSGMLDDIQIYNKRLTADEIHEIYKAGR